jgi:hypothetical protein
MDQPRFRRVALGRIRLFPLGIVNIINPVFKGRTNWKCNLLPFSGLKYKGVQDIRLVELENSRMTRATECE